MLMSFIYLALGLLLSNLGDVLTRNRESHTTPVKFNFMFWIRDNFIKVIHSVIIAVLLNIACNIDVAQTSHILTFEWKPIYSIGIGLFPDAVLSLLKNKLGWMQPKKAKDSNGKTYTRK